MYLTRRFGLYWFCSLLCAVGILFAGGTVLLHELTQTKQQQTVEQIAVQLEKRFISANASQSELQLWLPQLAKVLQIQSLRIDHKSSEYFSWQNSVTPRTTLPLNTFQTRLMTHPDMTLQVEFLPPLTQLSWSWRASVAVIASLFLVCVSSWFGARFFRQRLRGSDNLSRRAADIVRGRLHQAPYGKEQPQVIVRAMDSLIEQLQDSRKDRSRFDTYIRSNTFLDPVTGLGNRIFFDTRLDAAIKASPDAQGLLLLLQFRGLDDMAEHESQEEVLAWLKEISEILRAELEEVTEANLARRGEGDFALLLPGYDIGLGERLCRSLLKKFEKLNLPDYIDEVHCFHLGMVEFKSGDETYQLLSEADMALRAAQLQGPNTWYMYERKNLPVQKVKGSVRWRTLLQDTVRKRAFVLSTEPAVACEDMEIHHHETLIRVRDDDSSLISASVFLPMAMKLGMSKDVDRAALTQLFKLMQYEKNYQTRCSLNLSVESLADKAFVRWVYLMLMQYRHLLARLIIEVAEYPLSQRIDEVRENLLGFKRMGCQLAVDNVGQSVVSTDYIRELDIDYLKIHPSIVHDIDSLQENQLFVRSLCGASANTDVSLIALGVETREEWLMLKQLKIFAGQGRFFTESLRGIPAMQN